VAAIRLWNLMGGQIDYQALPLLVEFLGVEDVESVLDTLQDWSRKSRS
jgi:hypothetical protein